ncbi:MAG: AAA family ATPase [Phycisphaerales bacterium]
MRLDPTSTPRSSTASTATLDRSFSFRPHILHFIGHGEPLAGRQGRRVVVWARGEAARFRGAEDIVEISRAIVQLAYINACHWGSALRPLVGRRSVHRARHARRRRRTGAIDGAFAATLAASFYRELLRERAPVDVALAKARLDADQAHPGRRRDMFLPTLTVQADPARILALRDASAVGAGKGPTPVGDFVDRKAERRRLFADASARAPARCPSPVLLVRGAGEVGKSELVKVFLDVCARQGHLPVYCELTGKDPLDAEGVLERIHDAMAPKELAADDPRVIAFAEFRTRLGQLRAAQRAPSPAAAVATLTTSAARGNEDLVQGLFDAFAGALRGISQQRPVLVILDHLRHNGGRVAVEPWTLNMLPRLKEWASGAALGRARLVIVASVDESLELGLDDLVHGEPARERLVEVPAFSKDDAEWLLSEWLLRYVDQAMVDKLLPFLMLQATAEPVWKPTLIAQFRAMPAFAKGVRR